MIGQCCGTQAQSGKSHNANLIARMLKIVRPALQWLAINHSKRKGVVMALNVSSKIGICADSWPLITYIQRAGGRGVAVTLNIFLNIGICANSQPLITWVEGGIVVMLNVSPKISICAKSQPLITQTVGWTHSVTQTEN